MWFLDCNYRTAVVHQKEAWNAVTVKLREVFGKVGGSVGGCCWIVCLFYCLFFVFLEASCPPHTAPLVSLIAPGALALPVCSLAQRKNLQQRRRRAPTRSACSTPSPPFVLTHNPYPPFCRLPPWECVPKCLLEPP